MKPISKAAEIMALLDIDYVRTMVTAMGSAKACTILAAMEMRDMLRILDSLEARFPQIVLHFVPDSVYINIALCTLRARFLAIKKLQNADVWVTSHLTSSSVAPGKKWYYVGKLRQNIFIIATIISCF